MKLTLVMINRNCDYWQGKSLVNCAGNMKIISANQGYLVPYIPLAPFADALFTYRNESPAAPPFMFGKFTLRNQIDTKLCMAYQSIWRTPRSSKEKEIKICKTIKKIPLRLFYHPFTY